MEKFGQFTLDRERDIVVDVFRHGEGLSYVLRTPNHHTGNLITNLAALCQLPLSEDEHGLRVIRGEIPCYINRYNERLFIFRLGNTKVANLYPDGRIEMKASIPAISKTLMSQTKDYKLGVARTIVKTYIRSECKFETDVHTHMNGNLDPDVLIALGIWHQIRYPLYYMKKLQLRCTDEQWARLEAQRAQVAPIFADSGLTGRYLERRIDDHTFINFADLILGNPDEAFYNIERIRPSLTVPKDGQAVFANLEKVYLYRYVFTKGQPSSDRIALTGTETLPHPQVAALLAEIRADHLRPEYRNNTLFEDKLLWAARTYAACGIRYVEISDTTLVKEGEAFEMLRQIHRVMPAVFAETGTMIRFLAGIRRIPLTIVRDSVTGEDYFRDNLRVLRTVATDPYVAGADILGEEINDIQELQPVIRELVRIAGTEEGFVIRIHAGENDSLRDNVENSIRCVREALGPGQNMPCLRLGHGLYTANLNSAKGKRLLSALRENGVILEFQISSNVRLNNLSDLNAHPLKQYLREGVACVQGTDGGALYGTDSIDEELSLEKLLDLSFEELKQMRETDRKVLQLGMEDFNRKSRAFQGGQDVACFYSDRLAGTPRPEIALWQTSHSVQAQSELADRIAAWPQGLPVIVAGGSFNNSQHRTVMSDTGREVIDACLERLDPEKVFFVIGHRLTGYERYLVEQNRGRFRIFAIVPTLLSPAESRRLRKAGVGIRVSIEPAGISLYKSFAYELFKRRSCAVLALDGNSAAANLLQEARNGRYRSLILVDGHSRALISKAQTLQGYVHLMKSPVWTAEQVNAWQDRSESNR
ncbi:MAG: adenosine deaminase [Clostridia bacterium]|nr:adenosine deaminase [Clostridia bacterium]